MPLTLARAGETNIIRKVTGRDEVRRHLAELGFVVGAPVTVVSEIAGNMILSVKDSRVALDREMATRKAVRLTREEVAAALGHTAPSPDLPLWVQDWIKAEGERPWPPTI